MLKPMQRTVFLTSYVTHAEQFDLAYADLKQQAGAEVVPEVTARGWVTDASPEELREFRTQQAEDFIKTGELTTRPAMLNFDKKVREGIRQSLADQFLLMAHDIFTDRDNEKYPAKVRASAAPKFAEVLGIGDILRSNGSSTPQQAHKNMPEQMAGIGTLSERQVLTAYVREGENLEYTVRNLATSDPQLSALTPGALGIKLREWQQRGVVMDAEGHVMPWQEAIEELRLQLRTLEGAVPSA